MKFVLAILSFCCAAFISCKSQSSQIPNHTSLKTIQRDSFPKAIGYVNDFENLFTEAERWQLDSIIRENEKETTNQIAIVTIDSSFLNENNFDDYAVQLHNYWGVGIKGKDNGVLICLSKQLRKVRINNGYGIERLISNDETKKIIDIMTPEFKKENFFEGVLIGLKVIIEKTK